MERYDYEERARQRNQGGSDRSYYADRNSRSRDEEERYGRDESDFDRYSKNRYGRDSSSSRPYQGSFGSNQDRPERWNSQYSSNERFGESDRHEYRPQDDYRSARDEGRYGNGQHFQGQNSQSRAYNEYDQRFDSNLGGRNSSSRKDWDYDRTSSYPSYGSSQSSGYNSYGSNQYGSGQSYGSNQGSFYGGQRSGQLGGFGQNSGYGSSQNYGQEHGRNFGQGYNSSNYDSQYGQGNYNQGQSRYGSGSSYESHSGKGPKGYKRSDERIKEEFSDLLTSHHEIDPSEVEIKVSGSEVTLTGTVESKHEKRLIEDLASQISGVGDVNNQLRVQKNKSGQSQSFGSQSSSSQKEGSQQSSKSIQ